MDVSAPGYLTRNGQVNVRELDRPGPQAQYQLHCLYCGETYKSARVYDRACPGCQNGTPGPNTPPEWPADRRTQREQAVAALRQALGL